jgi:hypothetical protein
LPEGFVAKVGTLGIAARVVQQIAEVQRVNVSAARELAIRDVLLQNGAWARGLAGSVDARLAIRGYLARRLLHRLLVEARAAPPTEAELSEAAKRKWLEVDRPEGSVVVHAVVQITGDGDTDGEKWGRALVVVQAIRAAVQPVAEHADEYGPPPTASPVQPTSSFQASDPLAAAFQRAAATVPHGDLKVTVESLQPFASDGRVLTPGTEDFYDKAFAMAAAALPRRGALSDIVRTRFGAHIVLLLTRFPALVLTGHERNVRLRDDVLNERARTEAKKRLLALRVTASVATDAVGLLDLVSVAPDAGP